MPQEENKNLPEKPFNPDDIYHKASAGRLKNASDESESYDTIHFVSVNVEGSPEYERQMVIFAEESSLRLKNKFFLRLIFLVMFTAGAVIANGLYGRFNPYIIYLVYADLTLIALYIVYYAFRQYYLSRSAKKHRKKLKKAQKSEESAPSSDPSPPIG